jgi:hypothetical protein
VSVTDPGAHAVHADVDAGLYCPAAHAVQLTAPEPPTASVTEPAAHGAHADVAAALYCPAAHAVHRTAPVLFDTISANLPAAHVVHGVVDDGEYLLAIHAVQFVPPVVTGPVDTPVSVTDPGGHMLHDAAPLPENLPATQYVHIWLKDTDEYIPAGHMVHEVAATLTIPVPVPISASEPGAHVAHATVADTL